MINSPWARPAKKKKAKKKKAKKKKAKKKVVRKKAKKKRRSAVPALSSWKDAAVLAPTRSKKQIAAAKRLKLLASRASRRDVAEEFYAAANFMMHKGDGPLLAKARLKGSGLLAGLPPVVVKALPAPKKRPKGKKAKKKVTKKREKCGKWTQRGRQCAHWLPCPSHSPRSKVSHTENYRGVTIELKKSKGAKGGWTGTASGGGLRYTKRGSRLNKEALLNWLREGVDIRLTRKGRSKFFASKSGVRVLCLSGCGRSGLSDESGYYQCRACEGRLARAESRAESWASNPRAKNPGWLEEEELIDLTPPEPLDRLPPGRWQLGDTYVGGDVYPGQH
jgi:hypothetical protein